MATLASRSAGPLPLADSPLGRTIATTADRHLERLVRGRRARVRDLLRRRWRDRESDHRHRRLEGRPGPLARSRPSAGRRTTERRPRSTSPGPSSRRCRSGRRRCSCPPSRRPAADRAVSRCRPTRPSSAPTTGCWPRASRFDGLGPEHHRQVPGHDRRRAGHGGGDRSRRQRQCHGLVQRRAGGRRGRGGRARPSPARGRGPAGRRHGPGHHPDDGPRSRTGCVSRPSGTGSSPIRPPCRGRASRSSSGPTRVPGSAGCGPDCWVPRSGTTSTGRS